MTYVKYGNVWLWTEGVGARALTNSADAQQAYISDDGQVVAYVRQIGTSGPELWAINIDRSNKRQLVSTAEFWAIYTGDPGSAPIAVGPDQIDWRPGTHELYYSTGAIDEFHFTDSWDDLRMVDADTLAKAVLFAPGEGGPFYFSPDGAQIAIAGPYHIDLVNADGTNLRSDVLVTEGWIEDGPVWAPDSSGFYAVVESSSMSSIDFWYIPADGSPGSPSRSMIEKPLTDIWSISISPDMNRLAVKGWTDNAEELHLVATDGSGGALYLSAESLEFVGWAPDSLHFIFEVSAPEPLSGIHLGSVGGSYVTLAGDPYGMNQITWTDAAHYLYFDTRDIDSWEVKLRFETLGGESIVIDRGSSMYGYCFWGVDFVR